MTDKIDFKALRAQREKALAIVADLQVSEPLVIVAAAEYLAGPETQAFLDKLKEFEEVSQINSPFTQTIGNAQATIAHLRTHVAGAAQMLEAKAAAEAAKVPPAA